MFCLLDFRNSYKWIRLNLETVGVWPSQDLSIFTFCRVIINVVLIMICVYIPRCVALYYLRNYLDGAVYSTATNLIFIISVFKITIIFYYRNGKDI